MLLKDSPWLGNEGNRFSASMLINIEHYTLLKECKRHPCWLKDSVRLNHTRCPFCRSESTEYHQFHKVQPNSRERERVIESGAGRASVAHVPFLVLCILWVGNNTASFNQQWIVD